MLCFSDFYIVSVQAFRFYQIPTYTLSPLSLSKLSLWLGVLTLALQNTLPFAILLVAGSW